MDRKKRIDAAMGRVKADLVFKNVNVVNVFSEEVVTTDVAVADGCVVGAGSLLTKAYSQPNCVLAGVPAREVKQDVDWTIQRI